MIFFDDFYAGALALKKHGPAENTTARRCGPINALYGR
jgi:hypothetical protein